MGLPSPFEIVLCSTASLVASARYAGGMGAGVGARGTVVGVGAGEWPIGELERIWAGVPPKTYTGSPMCTRLWKYSAMCIGTRAHPCEAGPVGTLEYPCTAIPPLK